MNSFMNSSQHSIDLLNLSLLFSGFEVMLLKKAFALCLKDECTDSTRLLSPKGLHVISKAQILKDPCQPRSTVNDECGPPIAVLQDILHEQLRGQRVPRWKYPHGQYLVPINVYGCVDQYSSPLTFTQVSSNAMSFLGILRGLMHILSLSFLDPLPDRRLRDLVDLG
jgi:hypothetical protein